MKEEEFKVCYDDAMIRHKVASMMHWNEDDVSCVRSSAVGYVICACHSVDGPQDSFRVFVPLSEFAEAVFGDSLSRIEFDDYYCRAFILRPSSLM